MAAPDTETSARHRRATILLGALLAGLLVALAISSAAPADLQDELDGKQAALGEVKDREGVLSTEISRLSSQIDQLTGEVAALRNREAAVQIELDAAQAQLVVEQRNLRILRVRLERSIGTLEDRLVDIYKQDEPDALTVVLDSDGFEDALGRYEYLERIQNQDSLIVGRVREIRNDTVETVERIRSTRDSIVAKRDELARTRASLEIRQAELDAARARSQSSLDRTQVREERLEGDVSKLQDKIQAQLAAAAAEAGSPALPAGPIQGGSGAMIWPVSGPVTSPFGPRWGRMHEGIDIAVPTGTPIRAVQAGTVVLAAPTGGYGNYTCIDHGGGLSSCYAHQSSFAITSGGVSQGDIVGYVGCTGSCFGDHLHFEVRINGVATDPLGYL